MTATLEVKKEMSSTVSFRPQHPSLSVSCTHVHKTNPLASYSVDIAVMPPKRSFVGTVISFMFRNLGVETTADIAQRGNIQHDVTYHLKSAYPVIGNKHRQLGLRDIAVASTPRESGPKTWCFREND